jgi:MoCo/4Fe-4S cofactor protein with predicted Tat translocation signal
MKPMSENMNEKNQAHHDHDHSHGHDHDHGHDHNHNHAKSEKPDTHETNAVEIGNRYWNSLAQWADDPEFKKAASEEFKSSPLRDADLTENDKDGGWARREFLKLMGASLAMASTACIRRPVQKIIPYNKAPAEVTFGIPNYYTSTYFDGAEALGLLVKTREGRPIKIEGNPKHPLSLGGTSARAQASVLSLYDPDRLDSPKKNLLNKTRSNRDTISTTWEDADKDIVSQLSKGGVVVLTGTLASPSSRALVSEFVHDFKAKHVQWEALPYEEIREGQKASYGEDVVPYYHFDKARVIVSVDADFLGTWIAPTIFTRQFSKARKNPETMNKLVVFDSGYSLTGANADVRVKIKPSAQVDVVMGLAHEIVVKNNSSKYAGNAAVKNSLGNFSDVAKKLGISQELFSRVAQDLWKNKGQSLVVAGGLQGQTAQALELQIAVNFLNSVLENDGATVDGHAGFVGLKGSNKAMLSLIEDMKNGSVKTLIINGVNPFYVLTESLQFNEACQKVGLVVYTGDRIDETGQAAQYVLPDNHPMESWGDLEVADGVYSIQQPTLRPLNDTRSFHLSLMTWAKAAKVAGKRIAGSDTYYDYVRNVWKDEIYPKVGKSTSFENFWEQALQTGVVDSGKQAKSGAARAFRANALSSVKSSVGAKGSLELVLYSNIAIGDGRLANTSWLQELPDPVTKIVWDNHASVSIATAEKLKLKEGYLAELTVGTKKLKIPVHIQPGLHDDVVAVAVGYGRTAAGKLGNDIGVNAFALYKVEKGAITASGQPAELKALDEEYKLACVAGNNTMEGRKIVAEATLIEYLKDKAANNHRHRTFSIWSGHQYNANKWGMSVDLNSCTGCSACMVACQAENNIPIVGKNYVMQGREMHWIRIDRYYVGDPADAETVFQPVMCQQCDNAPCETVCPVLATVHSDEGLNDMAYNRCVGTRYCSNNCPYKVRRFNWFNFTGKVDKSLTLQYNPDVTVRPRGVMEKCTFCVHRIKGARSAARIENRELKTDEIKTACQQACPANAIIFGDLNDPQSEVAKVFKDEPRAYGLLEEFNAAPAVRYLTKIRNNDKDTRYESHKDLDKGGHS